MAFFFFNSHQAGTSVGIISVGKGIRFLSLHCNVTGSLWATKIAARASARFTPLVLVIKLGEIVFKDVIKLFAASYFFALTPVKFLSIFSATNAMLSLFWVKSLNELPSPTTNLPSNNCAWHCRQLGATMVSPLGAFTAVKSCERFLLSPVRFRKLLVSLGAPNTKKE